MMVYCIYDTVFYGLIGYNILEVVQHKGWAYAVFQRPPIQGQFIKVLETGFILKKRIYDGLFYL